MLNTIPMPAQEAKVDVLAMFSDQGPAHINCAQAVLRFVLLVTGSDPELMALARQFGGGIAGTGETCGALTGAALALSLRDYQAAEAAGPAASRKALQECAQRFSAEFGALRCRDLTGFDLATPEGHEAFVKAGGNETCRRFVGWMCDQILPLVEPAT
jgi:C_GCAxxG_C_C family probable redox protein